MLDRTTTERARSSRRRLRRLSPAGSRECSTTEPILLPAELFATAAWFGLLVGLIELAILLVRNALYGTATLGVLQLNRHFHWMVPAAHLAIFGAIGLALAPLGFVRSRWATRAGLFALGSIAAFGLISTIPGLHALAGLALALGLATRLVARIERHPAGFRRLVRYGLPAMATVVVAIAGLRFFQLAPAEGLAISGLPAARPGAPNVLLIVLDTVRADRLSLHGYARPTSPRLTELAARGVRFDHARATAPWTLPSHASLFTGKWPSELGVYADRPLESGHATLAEFLRDRGYATAGFVANTRFCNSWYGLGRGFIHYEDYYDTGLLVSFGETIRSAELGRRLLRLTSGAANVRPGETNIRKDAARINADFLGWLSSQTGERPFFAFLNYYDAHDPFIVPAGFGRRFGLTPETDAELALLNSPHVNERLAAGLGVAPRDIALVSDAYDDCLAYLDEQLGRLFDELERRGTLEDTLVVITSDHGEHLGEHGIYGHAQSLYRPEIHVPLVILGPGVAPAGSSVAEPVSLRDVAATIADRAGFGADSTLPGTSLARYWGGPRSDPADDVLSESMRRGERDLAKRWPPALRGPMQAVAAEGLIYIRNGDGVEELYDVAADPGELHDLSGSAGMDEALRRLRARAGRPHRDPAGPR